MHCEMERRLVSHELRLPVEGASIWKYLSCVSCACLAACCFCPTANKMNSQGRTVLCYCTFLFTAVFVTPSSPPSFRCVCRLGTSRCQVFDAYRCDHLWAGTSAPPVLSATILESSQEGLFKSSFLPGDSCLMNSSLLLLLQTQSPSPLPPHHQHQHPHSLQLAPSNNLFRQFARL